MVAFSVPIVLVRADPGGAEQNDPAPCVGHTDTSSPSSVRRRNERYWARANSSVRSGDTRSVRAAEPTSSDPPVNTPTGADPSSSRNDRCSWVCPGVASARSTSPPRSTSSPSRSPVCGNSRPTGRRRQHLRGIADGELAGSGQEIRMQVGVDRERDPQPPPLGGGADRPEVPARVQHQTSPVAQIQQVGRVAQSLVDDRDDGRVAHPMTGASAATRALVASTTR